MVFLPDNLLDMSHSTIIINIHKTSSMSSLPSLLCAQMCTPITRSAHMRFPLFHFISSCIIYIYYNTNILGISGIRVLIITNVFIIIYSLPLKQYWNCLFISVRVTHIIPSSLTSDTSCVECDQWSILHDHISGICKSTHSHLHNIENIENNLILCYNLSTSLVD